MALENPTWGQERIANELLLKLGLRVSPRTVRKYMPSHCVRTPGQRRQTQRWSNFIRNHAKGILACDFCVAITATFHMLYVFVVIEHRSRRLVHVNVTAHPTQGHLVFGDGVAQQVQNKLKGFVPHGALLAWRAPHEPKPCLKVDLYDSTAAAPHRGLRRDSRLSPLSGQTPSLACRALAGLLCDVVWLPQL